MIGDPRRWPEWCDAVGPDCRLTQRIVVEGLVAPAVVLGVAAGLAGSWRQSVALLHALVG